MRQPMDNDWGVVQKLVVEADTFAALLGACMVACVEHKNASYYRVVKDDDGGNCLCLLWTSDAGSVELPMELRGPEEIAAFVRAWLEKKAEYPKEEPDTDGDNNQGFQAHQRSFYDVVSIKPVYITYGK